jgi:hypothetical protein
MKSRRLMGLYFRRFNRIKAFKVADGRAAQSYTSNCVRDWRTIGFFAATNDAH